MYLIKGITRNYADAVTGQPSKRLAIRFDNKLVLDPVTIPFNTIDNPGQLRRAACDVLGIEMNQIDVSRYLKKIIAGRG